MASQAPQSPPSTPNELTLDFTSFSQQTQQDFSTRSFFGTPWEVEDQSSYPYLSPASAYVDHFDLSQLQALVCSAFLLSNMLLTMHLSLRPTRSTLSH